MATSQRNQFTATIYGITANSTTASIILRPLTTPSTWTSTITKTSATKFAIGQSIFGFALPVDITLAK